MKITLEVTIEELERLFGGKLEEVKEKVDKENSSDGLSIYARWFDEDSPCWTKNSEYNMTFLKQQQYYANDLLIRKGHLYLNEVYDMLGIPRSKAGQLAGWIYDENNYVDFALDNERNSDFFNGYRRTAILDFNVDGIIIDKI